VTTMLSLTSLGISFALAKKAAFGALGANLPLMIDPGSLAAIFALMLPVALFFSATMLAIGSFSRTTKEANSYLQPLLMVCIMPALASAIPGLELSNWLALVPVVNVSLASKEILSGTYHWNHLALIFGSTCVYAAAALSAAVALFKRESVLFRT